MSGYTTAPPVSVRLPTRVREQIDRLRDEERRSMNAQIIVLLEEALAARGGTPLVAPRRQPLVADAQPRNSEARRVRARPCPHRAPPGSYCKRCERVV